MARSELEAKGFSCSLFERQCIISARITGQNLANADVRRGEQAVKKCLSCHTIDPGGFDGIGPNLWGAFGQRIAANSNSFAYSGAMRATQGTWEVGSLDRYLEHPRSFIDGTKTTFAGMPDPQERADLIAYLNTLRSSPTPLSVSSNSFNLPPAQAEAPKYFLFGKPALVTALIYPNASVGEIAVSAKFKPDQLHSLLSEKYGRSQSFGEWRTDYSDSGERVMNKITWSYWKTESGMVVLSNSDGRYTNP